MATVYLGLGSNVGDTKKYLGDAVAALEALGTILKTSSLYRTEPVGVTDQPWFLNQVVELTTTLSPEDLLKKTQHVENDLGRKRPDARSGGRLKRRPGPRTIDIDILLYDNVALKTSNLTIPHPRMHERKFVLEPLTEIAPDATHPVLKKNIQGLLETTTDTNKIEKYKRGMA